MTTRIGRHGIDYMGYSGPCLYSCVWGVPSIVSTISLPCGPIEYTCANIFNAVRPNECNGVSNHRHLDCLLNHLSRRTRKKTSQFRITGLCEGFYFITNVQHVSSSMPSWSTTPPRYFPWFLDEFWIATLFTLTIHRKLDIFLQDIPQQVNHNVCGVCL